MQFFNQANAREMNAKALAAKKAKKEAAKTVLEKLLTRSASGEQIVIASARINALAHVAIEERSHIALRWANVYRKLIGDDPPDPTKPKTDTSSKPIAPVGFTPATD